MRARAALGDDRRAVAIDVERYHRVAKAAAIVVEIEDRSDESMRQPELVPHRVGVADIEIGLDQLGRQIAASSAMSVDADDLVGRFTPDITHFAATGPAERAAVDRVEGKDAEGGDPVLAEILILV